MVLAVLGGIALSVLTRVGAAATQANSRGKPGQAATAADDFGRAVEASRSGWYGWLKADGEQIEAWAKKEIVVASTPEEKAAWQKVAQAGRAQAAMAIELRDALRSALALQEETGTHKFFPGKGSSAQDRAEQAAFAESDAAADAWQKARTEWERAEAEVERLGREVLEADSPVKQTAQAKGESLPEPAFSTSWWCATNALNHSDQVCRVTREACESMDSATMHYMDCREEKIVTLLQFTQVNGGRYIMAFPLLSQCERKRKALMKNKVDYRDFTKCFSSASQSR